MSVYFWIVYCSAWLCRDVSAGGYGTAGIFAVALALHLLIMRAEAKEENETA